MVPSKDNNNSTGSGIDVEVRVIAWIPFEEVANLAYLPAHLVSGFKEEAKMGSKLKGNQSKPKFGGDKPEKRYTPKSNTKMDDYGLKPYKLKCVFAFRLSQWGVNATNIRRTKSVAAAQVVDAAPLSRGGKEEEEANPKPRGLLEYDYSANPSYGDFTDNYEGLTVVYCSPHSGSTDCYDIRVSAQAGIPITKELSGSLLHNAIPEISIDLNLKLYRGMPTQKSGFARSLLSKFSNTSHLRQPENPTYSVSGSISHKRFPSYAVRVRLRDGSANNQSAEGIIYHYDCEKSWFASAPPLALALPTTRTIDLIGLKPGTATPPPDSMWRYFDNNNNNDNNNKAT